ncbi:MAG TPA: hypothetical protein VN495_00740, partial [Candidatus Paceibacterota bacterium]|nr:hypothetical protein [Candidatus Paceibacterota bacterium]
PLQRSFLRRREANVRFNRVRRLHGSSIPAVIHTRLFARAARIGTIFVFRNNFCISMDYDDDSRRRGGDLEELSEDSVAELLGDEDETEDDEVETEEPEERDF